MKISFLSFFLVGTVGMASAFDLECKYGPQYSILFSESENNIYWKTPLSAPVPFQFLYFKKYDCPRCYHFIGHHTRKIEGITTSRELDLWVDDHYQGKFPCFQSMITGAGGSGP